MFVVSSAGETLLFQQQLAIYPPGEGDDWIFFFYGRPLVLENQAGEMC